MLNQSVAIIDETGTHQPLPVEYLLDATITVDEFGMPLAEGREVDQREFLRANPGSVDILLRDVRYIGHYFHFMELLFIVIAIIDGYWQNRDLEVKKIYVGNQDWSPGHQNNSQFELVSRVMPGAEIVGAQGGGSRACIVVDRDLATYSALNKFMEPAEEVLSLAAGTIRHRVMASIADGRSAYEPRRLPLALYVTRKPPRTLSPALVSQLEDTFRSAGFDFVPIDYSGMAFSRQALRSSRADVVVGVHGNGLTNCLWMHPGTTLIEIFPPRCHHYDYQLLAEAASLGYFGLEGVSGDGYVYTSGSRFGGAYGSPNDHEIHGLPWRRIRLILSELRQRRMRDAPGMA